MALGKVEDKWSAGRRQLCSAEMVFDSVCFVVLGIGACYFLKYFIGQIIDEESVPV